MKFLSINTLVVVPVVLVGLFTACDTVNSDTQPQVTREALETLELRGDDVVIDINEAFPNHTFTRIPDKFAENVVTIPGDDGNIRYIRYNPRELFDEPFNMELANARGEKVVSSLNLREASESVVLSGCRENTTEFTVENNTTLILDLFEEEDFCEWKDKINRILITGGPRSFESSGPGSQGMRVTIDEENPDNNLLFFRYFFGSSPPSITEPTPAVTGFVVAINYPEGTDIQDVVDNPELSEHYVERRIEVTVVPEGSMGN